MNDRTVLATLRNILANLYPDETSVRRVVADAGLDAQRIAFDARGITTWHAILTEAEKTGQINTLFTVVLGEYGTNEALRNACDAYRRYIERKSEVRDEKEEPQRPDERISPTDTSSEVKLYIQNIQSSGLGKDVHIIKGTGISEYTVEDKLVVYGEIIPGTEVAIALLQVTAVNPNSLSAQVILVHPKLEIRAGLRVDDKLEYLSTSELIPAVDYAVGYLLREGRVRLRPNSGVEKNTSLVVLEPQIVGGAILDHLETSTTMRVTGIGQREAVAEIELVTKNDENDREWPPVGTILKQQPKSMDPEPRHREGSISKWFPIAGTILLFMTVTFLMFIYIQGSRLEDGREFILILIAAFSGGGSVFFLGGWAKAEGTISIPGFPSNPITFGVTSGLAGFLIVLIIASLMFRVIVPSAPASPTPTPAVTEPSTTVSLSSAAVFSLTETSIIVPLTDNSNPETEAPTPIPSPTPTVTLTSPVTPTFTEVPLTTFPTVTPTLSTTPLPEGLAGWWKLDEDKGLEVADGSGFNKRGILQRGVEFTTTAVLNRALDFKTAEAEVIIPYNPRLEPITGTITVWMKLTELPIKEAGMVILGTTNRSTSVVMYSLSVGPDGSVAGLINGVPVRTGSDLITLEHWHHLALTWDRNLMSVYVDGEEEAAYPNPPTPDYDGTTNFIWAHSNSQRDNEFIGQLDEIHFYNRGLSPEEILKDYEWGAFNCTNVTEILPDVECEALVVLYKATGGATTWYTATQWLEPGSSPCDDWYQVVCGDKDETGVKHVIGLDLSLNGLNGPIPPELGNLSQLKELVLHENKLTGSIPNELGKLSHLQHLGLQDNQLSGTIPPKLKDLLKLNFLGLSGNKLIGTIPRELQNLKALTRLWLYDNELNGPIPAELGELNEHLKELNLSGNHLSGAIPPQLGSFVTLTLLYLYDNQLSGPIPEELGKLESLNCLHLNSNQLTGNIPISLARLKNLNDRREGPCGDVGLNLGYNALTTPDNQELLDFLNARDPDWAQTQRILTPEKLKNLPADIPSGQIWFNPVDEAAYVYVPAGDFTMGSDNEDLLANANEKPQHPVYVAGFWIMQTEVTNAQYARCVTAGKCTKPRNDRWNNAQYSDHPVANISWHQADIYASWVGGRLPTEAEWEKACRSTEKRIYPWGDALPDKERANFGHTLDDTMPVGKYPKGISLYGGLDMAGNVWEWTSSLNKGYPYKPDDGREDLQIEGRRILRGGAFNYEAKDIRCAVRLSNEPDWSYADLGFRVVIAK